MTRTLIAIAMLLCMGCATTLRREASLLVGATAFDITTSSVGRSHGGVEINPVLKNEAISIAINATLTYALIRYSSHLKSRGVRNWYIPMRIWSAIHIGAGGWNAVQMERNR